MQAMKGKDKFVMTVPLLANSKGIKIGKSEGNVIALTDRAHDMFGKIMSLGDDVIGSLFTLLTDLPPAEIKEVETKIKDGQNPMDFKKQAATLIVAQLHSPSAADAAQKHFESTVQAGNLSSDPVTVTVSSYNIVDVLVETGLASSKSEAKRLIDQGGVKVDNSPVTSLQFTVTGGSVISVGNRKFVKISN